MEKSKSNSNTAIKDCIVENVMQSKFGEHNFILYSDIATLRNIYFGYCKTAFESLNEIVLLLPPYYESVSDVFSNLGNDGNIDVEKYKKEGSLVLVEPKKGYFSLTNELVGIMIMVRMLLQRASKLEKNGVAVISDMGIFFHMNKVEELIKHERELLLSSIHNMKVKIFCCYNKADLKLLTEQQMQELLTNHNKIISTETHFS
jgi:hypothetical protein